MTGFVANRAVPMFVELPSVATFPEQATEFAHDLHVDDRLSIESVAQLADRRRGSVVHEQAIKPLLSPEKGPPRGRLAEPGEVIRNLEHADAWLTLLNVEKTAPYAELMKIMLDQIEQGVRARQGRMCNRAAFIITSSPNSVTPVHFDMEHSLLMQVSGSRTLSVGSFETMAKRQHEIERYFDGSHGRIESLMPKLSEFRLAPGRGVYIPRAVPHWLHNGPAVSVSMTLTYFTTETLRENRIEDFNGHLRRLHMTPQPAGESPAVDLVKTGIIRALGSAITVNQWARRGSRHR